MGRAQEAHRPAETRWPVMLAIVVVFVLLGMLPERIRLASAFVPYLLLRGPAGRLARMIAHG